jgi:sugar/nucleoside kinase (ribokinase family)
MDRLAAAAQAARKDVAIAALTQSEAGSLILRGGEVVGLVEAADFALIGKEDVDIAALTQSEAGSLILRGGETVHVAAERTQLVDSTGAGDAYAAGFLAAYTKGRDLSTCGKLGSLAAAEIISHYGARPMADFSAMLASIT